MPKKTQLTIPDDIYQVALIPIAKFLKMRYIPKNPKMLVKSIFNTLAQRAKEHSLDLQPIINNVADISGVASSYLEIAAAIIQPLLTVIPPQYLLIIIAIILVPTVIIPARIAGLVLWYHAERWLKLPFIGRSKKEIDKVPKQILNSMFIIDRITKRTITTTWIGYFTELSEYQQDAYFYEADVETKAILKAIKDILEKFPKEQLPRVADSLTNFNIPLIGTFDFNQEIELSAHFYYGKKRLLPPFLTKIVKGMRNLLANWQALDGDSKTFWLDMAKIFTFGVFGAAEVTDKQKDKSDKPSWLPSGPVG